MKLLKRILLGLLVVAVVATLGFVIWAETPLGPAPEALAALESDSQVTVTTGDFITFEPANQRPASVGFIFYPGGRVDARSYAVPLREIAAQGYLVVLVPVRLNLAFFDVNAAAPVIAAYPEIEYWVIGGHSLGGVASELFAKDYPEISGITFWAAYPADDGIKNSNLRVLSIYGTKDMAGMAKFEETKALNARRRTICRLSKVVTIRNSVTMVSSLVTTKRPSRAPNSNPRWWPRSFNSLHPLSSDSVIP